MITDQTPYRVMSDHLGRLADALEDLVYHLEVESLVLSAGNHHRLARAASDVERSAAKVAELELARGEFLRLEQPQWARMTLAELADSADEPWRGVLHLHRERLDALRSSAADRSDECGRAARLAARRNREMLDVVAGPAEPLVEGFGRAPVGAFSAARPAPILVDRSV